MIGAHEDALARHEKAVAVADVNWMLDYGEADIGYGEGDGNG